MSIRRRLVIELLQDRFVCAGDVVVGDSDFTNLSCEVAVLESPTRDKIETSGVEKEEDDDEADGLGPEGEDGKLVYGPQRNSAAPPVVLKYAAVNDYVIGPVADRYSQPAGPTFQQPQQQSFLPVFSTVNEPIIGPTQSGILEVRQVVVQPPAEGEADKEAKGGESISLSLKLDTSSQASPKVEVFSEGVNIEVFNLEVNASETTTVVSFSVKVQDLPVSAPVVTINVSQGYANGIFQTSTEKLLKAFEKAKAEKVPAVLYDIEAVPAKDVPISFSIQSSQQSASTGIETSETEVTGNSLGNFFRSASTFLLKLVGMA